MDIQKQIDYWRDTSDSDIEAAELLLKNGKLTQGMFFVHLALEKILKAHVVRTTKQIPPKIHFLIRLMEIAGLVLPKETVLFLKEFEGYQIEGRYPGPARMVMDERQAMDDCKKADEIRSWLKSQL